MRGIPQSRYMTQRSTITGGTLLLQRSCACGQHTFGGSSCEECKRKGRLPADASLDTDQSLSEIFKSGNLFSPVRPKLLLNEPGDNYEQEADRIADKVMHTVDSETGRPKEETRHPLVQRRAANSSDGVQVTSGIARAVDDLRG